MFNKGKKTLGAVACPLHKNMLIILADKGLDKCLPLSNDLYPIGVLLQQKSVLVPCGLQCFLGIMK